MSPSPLARALLAAATVFVGGSVAFVLGAPREAIVVIGAAVMLLVVLAENRNGTPN